MPTELTKIAFNKTMKLKAQGKPVIMRGVMKESGYSDEMSKHPGVLIASKGWNELLAKYDEEPIMDAIYQDALDKKDKRNATENRKLLLKLKGRFVEKIAISKVDESLSRYIDDKPTEDTEDNPVYPSQESEADIDR